MANEPVTGTPEWWAGLYGRAAIHVINGLPSPLPELPGPDSAYWLARFAARAAFMARPELQPERKPLPPPGLWHRFVLWLADRYGGPRG